MEKSIEADSTISVNISDKSYIGKVLNLWEGSFKIILNGTKKWKDGRNTRSFACHSIDKVTKLN